MLDYLLKETIPAHFGQIPAVLLIHILLCCLLCQGTGALLAKGQSLVIDEIQGYESDAVRLRLMAPNGKDLPATKMHGASTYELPFPPPSGIESNQAPCVTRSYTRLNGP